MATQIAAADDSQGTAARVLVVDDDAANRALCALTLQLAGFDVLEAEDGQRGLELARSQTPDLAVLDVRMPRLDGFGLAAALRSDARTRALPFMFLTGETNSASRDGALALGAAGYLTKPFDPRVLEALVARLTGGRSPAASPAEQRKQMELA